MGAGDFLFMAPVLEVIVLRARGCPYTLKANQEASPNALAAARALLAASVRVSPSSMEL